MEEKSRIVISVVIVKERQVVLSRLECETSQCLLILMGIWNVGNFNALFLCPQISVLTQSVSYS